MKSPSTPRSLLAAARAGLALVVVHLSALTGCAGAVPDEADPSLVDDAALLDNQEEASPLLHKAKEGSASLADPSGGPRDGDDASGPASDGSEAGALGKSQQPLFGSDTCRDVIVAVRNFLSDPITVRSIEYYNASEGRWQTEDLANRDLDPDGGLEMWFENLASTENDLVSSANLLYDHVGHTHNEHFNIPDQNCMAGIILFDLFVE